MMEVKSVHYTNEQIGRKKLLTFFFIMITKIFFCLWEPMESTQKIKPSRILIILQCIASVLRPGVVMQIKKKHKKQKISQIQL